MNTADRKLVYLAQPYTHHSADVMAYRESVAKRASGLLSEHAADALGVAIYSPILHGAGLATRMAQPRAHAWWMAQCKPMVMACQELWLLTLEGWSQSSGVEQELIWAAERPGVVVRQVHPDFLQVGPSSVDEELIRRCLQVSSAQSLLARAHAMRAPMPGAPTKQPAAEAAHPESHCLATQAADAMGTHWLVFHKFA